MFRISFAIVGAACAAAQAQSYTSQGPAIAVPGYEINSGVATLRSGIVFRYKSMVTPDEKGIKLIATGVKSDGDRIHRFLIEKTTGSYFGYDLAIGDAGGGRYLAEFLPLATADGVVADISGDDGLKPLALPKYPPPQYVREGDIIALDLMISADGKRRITDYLEVVPPLAAAASAEDADAQDISLDDGPVTFSLPGGQISVNGESQSAAFTSKPGATFWIALPGEGRYILSLAPHAGFVKSGTVRGSTLSFHDGARQIAVRFAGPVAAGGHAWNVYMLHDSAYQSAARVKGQVAAAPIVSITFWLGVKRPGASVLTHEALAKFRPLTALTDREEVRQTK